MNTATTANEAAYNSGVSNDYCLLSELADYEAEQDAEDVDLMTTAERHRINAAMADWWGA